MAYESMTRDQAIERLASLEASHRLLETKLDIARANEMLVRELRLHQGELEAQNQELRDVQGALEESRGRYADLYDFAPIAYLTFDRAGNVQELNFSAAAMLGQDRGCVIGKPFLTFAHFVDATVFWQHLQRCLEGGGTVSTEFRFALDGRWVDVQVLSTPVLEAGLRALTVRSAFIDIGRRRDVERESARLHETSQRLQARLEAIDHASVAFTKALASRSVGNLRSFLQVVVDEARAVVGAEYAALGVGGLGGTTFDPWVYSGMTQEHAAAIGRVPRAVGVLGMVAHTEKRVRIRDLRNHSTFGGLPAHHPEMTSFLGVAIRYEGQHLGNLYMANKIDGAEFSEEDQCAVEMLADRVGVALEIARLQEVEERERRRLRFLARASAVLPESMDFDATLEAIACVAVPELADFCLIDLRDESGCFRRVAAHHHDDSKPEFLLQRSEPVPVDALPSPQKEAVRTRQPQLREVSPAEWFVVIPMVLGDEVMGLMQLAAAGETHVMRREDLPLCQEIAHHAVMAIGAARLHRATEAAVMARDSLFRVVSHDLRNFLNTIVMGAELLLRGKSLEEPRTEQRQIAAIKAAAVQMDQLIGSLRDATMIESGQFSMRLRPEEPENLIQHSLSILGPQVEAASLQLEVELPDALPTVRCDRERILQVFVNLIGNAVKFSGRHGAIRVGGTHADDCVRFWVADQGPGISEPDLTRVFERYWRSDLREKEGTGLGLYIAKGIIDAHGGRIWVESEVGKGTVFHFSLPTAPPS